MGRVTALNVNGGKLFTDVDSATTLLSVLRNDLNLTGSKYGCGEGQCGAGPVLVDGQLTRSCITQVGRATGKEITTIAGLEKDGRLPPLQSQFENGKILNPTFSSYRVPRFIDMAAIEVVLVDRKDIASAGAGETQIVGLAPAVGKASSTPPGCD